MQLARLGVAVDAPSLKPFLAQVGQGTDKTGLMKDVPVHVRRIGVRRMVRDFAQPTCLSETFLLSLCEIYLSCILPVNMNKIKTRQSTNVAKLKPSGGTKSSW